MGHDLTEKRNITLWFKFVNLSYTYGEINRKIECAGVNSDESHSMQTDAQQLITQIADYIGAGLHVDNLLPRVVQAIYQALACEQVVLAIKQDDPFTPLLEVAEPILNADDQQALHDLLTEDCQTLLQLRNPGAYERTVPGSANICAARVADVLGADMLILLPLTLNDEAFGTIFLVPTDPQRLREQVSVLHYMLPTLAVAVKGALMQASQMRQSDMLQQIDAELNDQIELGYVFQMVLDWALRYTNAHRGGLLLYDQSDHALRPQVSYGYTEAALAKIEQSGHESITQQAASEARIIRVDDAHGHSSYLMIHEQTNAQLSVPILRRRRVIAVLTLESDDQGGFTADHERFVERLAQRAGVALDNARLFHETNQQRQRLDYILRNIIDAVIVIDPHQRIIFLNRNARHALRLPDTEVESGLNGKQMGGYSGQLYRDVIADRDLSATIRRGQTEPNLTYSEHELSDGRAYRVHVDWLQDLGWIVVMQDITHFKEAEKLKTELLATVSHDLKQPLSVIGNYIHLLRRIHREHPKSQYYIDRLRLASTTMQQLIDDLLDIAHIESGLRLQMTPVDLKQVAHHAIDLMQQEAQARSQNLKLDLPPEHCIVKGDAARIQQILSNLIGNAVKYTQEAGWIHVHLIADAQAVQIRVADNGIGISAQDQKQVFERFYRVRSAYTDKINGTGLGLSIVKSLVEAHNGSIELESEPNKGSIFTVTLPRAQD